MSSFENSTDLNQPPAYEAVTHDIAVRVRPSFLPEQSDPRSQKFLWAYEVEIENLGSVVVQLRSRHWIITDSLGRIAQVDGEGVVGKQPVLRPGQAFRYSSGCPLDTSSGVIEGFYDMVTETGETFRVVVPAFSLDVPGTPRVMH